MKVTCPSCGKEYDTAKNLGISNEALDLQVRGKGIIKITVACKCHSPFEVKISRPTASSWTFFKKLGKMNVEVWKRATTT